MKLPEEYLKKFTACQSTCECGCNFHDALEEAMKDSYNQAFILGAEFRQPEIDELKEKLERVTKWISIDDELPPLGKYVLLRFGEYKYEVGWLMSDKDFAYNVSPTHWRYIE